jgi:hypothetical protein
MPQAKRASRKAATVRRAGTEAPPLVVEVVWADITEVAADVYAAGHYEQVLPQSAELALDRMVSAPGARNDDLVLTNLTRRGILRGALGDVSFFPWASTAAPDARGRVVAIAGMGHPGSFGVVELRRVARNLAWAISSLPDARTVCTVLIGAGFGNLTLADAVNGLMAGMADAMVPGIWSAPVQRLRIVERELGKARAIYQHLRDVRARPEVSSRVNIELEDGGVRTERGGEVGTDYCMALTLAAAARAAQGDGEQRESLHRLLDAVDVPERFRDWACKGLSSLRPASASDLASMAARLRISIDDEERRESPAPTRLSFVRDGKAICAAALSDTTVVPERRFEVDDALIAATVGAMTDPDIRRVGDLSTFLTRLVVPRDFRELVSRAPQLVVEIDRDLARVPWEMMSDRADGSMDARPVALKVQVARQLRTAYSPPPSVERVAHWPLRALVIGDPGDPAKGDALPGARREALTITQLLRAKGLDVTAMIGATSVKREGELRLVAPADRLDVLMQLMGGEYDLLHYAGHGDFDPEHPELTGWVFEGGLLTSRLLERVDLAPSLVVANACLSARTSDTLQRGGTTGAARSESDLLPGLADEFFRRGVRNYVGTAWAIDDGGAVEFAKEFYDALLPSLDERGERNAGASVGEALLRARLALKEKDAKYGALWAAYQHYGDPEHTLVVATAGEDGAGD